MYPLTTLLVGRACRIFLDLAYPGGLDTIPMAKRIYYDLPVEQPLNKFLAPVADLSLCQEIPAHGDAPRGYALRLGSAHFPHLKLRMQLVADQQGASWVFMVDTHDSFSKDSLHPPPGHPDAAAWLALQESNRRVKEQIETAFEQEGLVTCNSLLQKALQR